MKNKNNLLVIILIIIIICLLGYIAHEKIITNNDTKIEESKNNNSETKKFDYSRILEEYKTSMNTEDFDFTNEAYKNINANIVHLYQNHSKGLYEGNMIISYAYYDINKDNNDELIISFSNDNDKNKIAEIYTNDSTNIYRFFNEICLGERCSAEIWENGIIQFEGSAGVKNHSYNYSKIASNGYTREIIKEYEIEYSDNYPSSFTITNDKNEKENYNSIEEFLEAQKENTTAVDLTQLNWNEIK